MRQVVLQKILRQTRWLWWWNCEFSHIILTTKTWRSTRFSGSIWALSKGRQAYDAWKNAKSIYPARGNSPLPKVKGFVFFTLTKLFFCRIKQNCRQHDWRQNTVSLQQKQALSKSKQSGDKIPNFFRCKRTIDVPTSLFSFPKAIKGIIALSILYKAMHIKAKGRANYYS